jgi:isopentenyl-diphosphate Delta-isomerase
MSEEIFDIVNERDEVIGQLPRGEVHRQGLRHRAVHLMVFDRRGNVFLQKRSMKKDCFPGAWDSSAAGHLDCGETYDACVFREAREELGLHLAALPEKIMRIEACPGTGMEFVWVYRCVTEGPFVLHPEEIDTGGWFAPEHLTEWVRRSPAEFAPSLLLIWERLQPAR